MSSPGPQIRPLSASEFPEYFRAVVSAFGDDYRESEAASDRSVFEPERSLAVLDRDQIVGTAGAFTRQLTLPGATTPVAAVTMVSVAPTHRRRGLLTAMMRRQLTEVFEAGREPVAALWASEAVIYGRFGYGMAARHATVTGQTRRLGLRPGATRTGQVRQVSMEELPLLAGELRDRLRPAQVGWLDRTPIWWEYQFYDAEHVRGGASALRAVVCEDAGRVTGYAAYRIKADWSPSEPNNEVLVREIVADSPGAYATVWSFLLELDLVRRVRAPARPLDEPLQHLVADARAVELSVGDNLWVRPVDVGRALAARRYATEVDVVLEVADEFCPWNAGRWRLTGGPQDARCSRTTASADLALTSTELGAALLGGTTLASLGAAGRVCEHRPGILSRASIAFAAERAPYCPDRF